MTRVSFFFLPIWERSDNVKTQVGIFLINYLSGFFLKLYLRTDLEPSEQNEIWVQPIEFRSSLCDLKTTTVEQMLLVLAY